MMTNRYSALPENVAREMLENAKEVHSASRRCNTAMHRRRTSSDRLRRVLPEIIAEETLAVPAVDASDPDESGPQIVAAPANKF
jgi:hypothetical protein